MALQWGWRNPPPYPSPFLPSPTPYPALSSALTSSYIDDITFNVLRRFMTERCIQRKVQERL